MATLNIGASIERARAALSHPRLPDAVALVLVIVLGWQLAGLTWAALPAPANTAPPRPAAPTAMPQGASGQANRAARVARLHLFGTRRSDDTAAQGRPAAIDAPETQLNLALKGLYAVGNGRGIAIISVGGGPEKIYTVGDAIAGSAHITGIYADRVVLRRQGHAETLRLPFVDDTGGARRTAVDSSAARGRAIRQARQFRSRLRNNPLQLASMVRFQPYIRNGNLVGYRITARSEKMRFLAAFGIGPNDVITRINGIPLNSPENGRQALRALRNAEVIRATVLSNGRTRRITIPIGDPG